MAVMMGKLYSALRAANVAEDKAREAAEEVAGYEREFADIKSDLRLLKWMIGTNAAVTLAVLGLVLQILLHGVPVPHL